MADVPWFMLSPSPVSLIQYAILTWIGSKYLLQRVDYKHPRIMSLIQSFLVVALFVVITDSFWAGLCAIRFLPMFPQDAQQITSSFVRDVVGALLFFLLIGNYFRTGVLNFGIYVKAGLHLCLQSQAIWFLLAPSPAFTDYTFAWRYGYPLEHILAAWLLSHFLLRLPLWMSIIAAFKYGRKPQDDK